MLCFHKFRKAEINTGSPKKMERGEPSTKVQNLFRLTTCTGPWLCASRKLSSWKQSLCSLPDSLCQQWDKNAPRNWTFFKRGKYTSWHLSMCFFFLSPFPIFQKSCRNFISETFVCLFILDPVLHSKWEQQPALIWTGLVNTYFLPAFGLERHYFPLVGGLCVKWPTAGGFITSASLEEFCTY